MTSEKYTHTKCWLSSLKLGEKVLISLQHHHNDAESDGVVTKITPKFIHVDVDENMPGHVWGKTLVFNRETGEQKNHLKGHWIRNRKLIRFTESRWRKILKIRKVYKDRMRIFDAIHHRRVPDLVLADLAVQLEKYPHLPGHKKAGKSPK